MASGDRATGDDGDDADRLEDGDGLDELIDLGEYLELRDEYLKRQVRAYLEFKDSWAGSGVDRDDE